MKDSIRYIFKEDIQMAKKYMKSCSASPVIREMPIKTTVRHHFILMMPEDLGTSYVAARNVKWYRRCGKL